MGIEAFIAGLLNPQTGLLFLLAVIVYFLAQDHRKNVDNAKTERIERLQNLLDVATVALQEQTAANAKGAEAQEDTARAVQAIAATLRAQQRRSSRGG